MSGIAGILRLDGGAPDETDLRAMAGALAHRGPDGSRIVQDGPLGLVHVLLKIDDEAPQPLEDGALLLAMDGRVDNPGTLSKSKTGPESVLAAWRRRGARALPLILGDWALALWDGKALTLARDPIGLRPLYYFQDETRLIFASEIKAILAVNGVPSIPDEEALSELARYRFRSMERTYFEGVRRLAPGAALRVEGAKLVQSVFWRPNPNKKIRLPSREAYRAKFRALFVEAVRCRLPRHGTAAVRLSGGLDSSAIAGAAALVRGERPGLELTTSSITSDVFPETDERRYSGAVCAAFGLPNEEIVAERLSLTAGLADALRQQESPFFEPIDVWVLEQFRVSAASGAKAVLGGDWGDQIMGGSGYLADLLSSGRLLRFWREFLLYRKNEEADWRHIAKEVLRDLAPRRLRPRRAPLPRAAQRQLHDGVFGIHNVLMLELLDKQAAMHGTEARLPFLDRRLVSFMLAIPAEEHTRDGITRRLEREALGGMLLESIAARRDKGDCTDLEAASLRRAGFAGGGPSDLTDSWRRNAAALWRKTWSSERTRNRRTPTRPLALSNTAT